MSGSRLYLYLKNVRNQDLSALKNGYLPVTESFEFLEPYCDYSEWVTPTGEPVQSDIELAISQQYQNLPDNYKNFLPFETFSQQPEVIEKARIHARNNLSGTEIKLYRTPKDKLYVIRLYPDLLADRLWRNDAENFSGLCIRLEVSNAWFFGSDKQPRQFGPVKYGAHHHPAPSDICPFPELNLGSECDASQKEWRLVGLKSECKRINGVFYLKVPFKLISGVYRSFKCPEFSQVQLEQLLRTDMHFSAIETGVIEPSAEQWKLNFRPVSCLD